MTSCRLIVDGPRPGDWNMAVDEVLLDAAATRGVPTLRFYQWSEPTLSLGYFQSYKARLSHEASRGISCIRRHSGGGAILHDQELTYSLSLPAQDQPSGGPVELYQAVHGACVSILERMLPALAGRLGLCRPGLRMAAADEPFLCFLRRSEGDLLVTAGNRDHKVLGSAQRKRRGAVLQHGSILLARSASAPELPGLAELSETDPLQVSDLVVELSSAIGRFLQRELQPISLAATEVSAAEKVAQERFRERVWTQRR